MWIHNFLMPFSCEVSASVLRILSSVLAKKYSSEFLFLSKTITSVSLKMRKSKEFEK